MAFRGYVLIEAEVGHAKGVGEAILELQHHDARITAVDTVTGPYDVIVKASAENVDQLGKLVVARIQSIEGITRTLTCPIVHL